MTISDVSPLLQAAICGYFLGTIPWGLVLTRLAGAGDIRQIGSGSIGATNVLRTGRKGLAAATLALDAAKGAIAVLIGALVAPDHGMLAAGVAVMLGHVFPVWLGFKGGKGVATGLGVLLATAPLVAALCGGIWLALAFALRISSVAGLGATLAAPILVWLLGGGHDQIMLIALMAVLVCAKHHTNIARLLAGTEPRIGQK